jgi:hypothetical protein
MLRIMACNTRATYDIAVRRAKISRHSMTIVKVKQMNLDYKISRNGMAAG